MTGAVALGNDFFNRQAEMARFGRDLEADNLLLLAPLRVGKTSLIRKIGEHAANYGFGPFFADVSDCVDEAVFTIPEADRPRSSWLAR